MRRGGHQLEGEVAYDMRRLSVRRGSHQWEGEVAYDRDEEVVGERETSVDEKGRSLVGGGGRLLYGEVVSERENSPVSRGGCQ